MRLFYHDEDGRLTGQVAGAFTPDELADLRTRGLLFVKASKTVAFGSSYVRRGRLARRPVAPVVIDRTEIPADGEAAATITGLPEPCQVLVDGEPVTVEGGRLELTADMPAIYSIVLDQFPFMPWSAEIVAT